jgi:hypothetical protein
MTQFTILKSAEDGNIYKPCVAPSRYLWLLRYGLFLTSVFETRSLFVVDVFDVFEVSIMTKITFAGISGEITATSPHNNYLVVQLSDRVAICGTYSNIWNWSEINEIQSGFESFITYISLNRSELLTVQNAIAKHGGYFRAGEELPRPAKRVITDRALELKVRDLSVESVVELARTLK